MTSPTFAVEPLHAVLPELRPLLPSHWAELASYPDIPLDPNYDLYLKIADAGMLTVYTARLNDTLIGYALFFLHAGHMHYRSTGWAMNDIVWLHPTHRNLGIGRDFVAFWDADLRDRGIDVVHIDTKLVAPALAHLLGACCYSQITLGFERRLS